MNYCIDCQHCYECWADEPIWEAETSLACDGFEECGVNDDE